MVEVCFASVKNIEIFDVFRDYLCRQRFGALKVAKAILF